jgi:exosortase A-associated hydrolase 1
MLLPCEGEHLLAILTEPARPVPGDLGVVIIVGGPQYRGGSHRQFVQLARALAGAGFPTLRFDVRGMGDATGPLHDFEEITPDIGAAIDGLCAANTKLRRIVLWGLCDGASAALIYLDDRADPRVQALAMVNPWVRTVGTQARARLKHYYLRRIFSPDFWRKALRGRVGLVAATELLGTARAAGHDMNASTTPGHCHTNRPSHAQRMTRCAFRLDLPVLLQMSGSDHTAREFDEYTAASPSWQRLLRSRSTVRADFPEADHTFSGASTLQHSLQGTLRWIQGLEPAPLQKATR